MSCTQEKIKGVNKMKKYIDAKQYCNECGCQFIIRVYGDGTYDYLTEFCECESESGFTPCEDGLSISQIVDSLNVEQ